MDILSVLDELERLVVGASRVPFTGKALLDGEVLLGLIDKLRSQVPEEVRQARWTVRERERIMQEARQEAARLVEEGRWQSGQLVQETEVSRRAQAQADEIVLKGQQRAQELYRGALNYASEILDTLQTNVEKILAEIREAGKELGALEEKAEGTGLPVIRTPEKNNGTPAHLGCNADHRN